MEDASLTTKGVVKLSSAVDSTSESLAATPKAVKAANDNANSRVPSNRKVNGKALTADITLTPKDIGTLNSVTMSFSGGAGWFKLATVTMPQASSIVYIALIGGAGYNVGSPHQAGISELVLRAGNGNPKGITGALWKRTAVGLTNFAWINTSGDTYDIYVEIGNYATRVNIHWDCTSNATVSIYTSPTYSASKPSSVTDGVVYTMYSTHQKPTPLDIGALPTTGGTVSGPLSVTGGLTGSLNGNASTATKLQTARSIGGVVFDGSANINLPGVNTTGNQNTTGNAATATKLQTARKISGVPFDGSTDITLTAAHVAGTNEFIGEGDAYIPPHTGLPANSTDIAPPDIPAGFVAVFNSDEASWHLVEDHRGKTVYDVASGDALFISELGPLPENVTWLSPEGEFQKWNGTAWVKDTEAEKLFRIREAEETKNNLMQVASEHIAPLQDAADLEIATEEEISLLEAWKKYRVLLNRVDTSTSQDIEWPALP
ncbi:hypothetical protein GRW53_17330 [Escherichia coli]|nr:hypothetical protein [Escherichia coli]